MDAMNKLISYKAGMRQNDSLSALSAIRTEQHTLSVQEQMEEMFFLGLRKNNGISEADFLEKFKKTVDDVYVEVLEKNQKFGLLVRENGRIFLTKRGREISNVVMAEFLLD
jgi:oxygen-independent coproporphyrinogen-3 oxidase